MKELKITTSHIAKICDVSQGTVDRALNGRTGIKAETKQKILDVAKQYGYREKIDLAERKNKGQIGIVVFDLNNEYFSDLITELEFALRKEGMNAVVTMTHYDKQYEIESILDLYNMGVKGIVLCAVNSGKDFENYLSLFNIPVVSVGNRVNTVAYVGIDDFTAMKELTERNLAEDYDDIIYFSPALNYADASAQRKRYEGFLNAVGDKSFKTLTEIDEIQTSYERKTLIICSNDYYALKVYFKTKGAKIVGFDNISVLDKYNIPIETVGYSTSEIAEEVIRKIKNNEKRATIVKHYFVSREK